MMKAVPITGGESETLGFEGPGLQCSPEPRHLGLHPLGRLYGEPAGEDIVSISGFVTKR